MKEIFLKWYFKNYLPDFVRERLDFSELQQLPGTYLSDELKKTMSDIIPDFDNASPKMAIHSFPKIFIEQKFNFFLFFG